MLQKPIPSYIWVNVWRSYSAISNEVEFVVLGIFLGSSFQLPSSQVAALSVQRHVASLSHAGKDLLKI